MRREGRNSVGRQTTKRERGIEEEGRRRAGRNLPMRARQRERDQEKEEEEGARYWRVEEGERRGGRGESREEGVEHTTTTRRTDTRTCTHTQW